jgi:hypothetical protein
MTVHKYAMLVEIDNNNYEVFHVIRLSDSTPEALARINRIDEVLDSGETIVGQPANEKPGLLIGSTWDGLNFTLPNPIPEEFIGTDGEAGVRYSSANGESMLSGYTLLSNNKVFYMMAPIKGSILDEKFAAAFSGNVTLKKIDEDASVTVGYIWDGTNFTYTP